MMTSFKISLKRSTIGCSKNQKNIIKALGLKKINSQVIKPSNDSIKGMIKIVSHLINVEEA